MRTCTFDIETTSLDAVGAGFILCVVIKPYHRPRWTFRIDQYKKDSPGKELHMLTDVLAKLGEHDLLIGHNAMRFDWRYLKSRAMRLGLPEPKSPFIYDTMQAWRRIGMLTVPNYIGKPSAGLAHMADFLGLPQEKTHVMPGVWWSSIWGDAPERAKHLNAIVAHCQADVSMTEKAYDIVLPLDAHASIRRAR